MEILVLNMPDRWPYRMMISITSKMVLATKRIDDAIRVKKEI